MHEMIRTFRSSTFSKEFDVGDADKLDTKNGSDSFNQDLADDNASLTTPSEGRIAHMSSEVLKNCQTQK